LPGGIANTTNPAGAAPKPTAKGGPAGTTQLPATLAARATPRDLPGAVRWVLVAVVIVGVAGGLSGGLLRSTGWWHGLVGRLRR
jgi:hypothetical protein